MTEWISVEDRLPDNDRLKAVRYSDFYSGKNRGHLGITLSRFRVYYGGTKPTWEFDHSTQPTRVTHWCDLPEFPSAKRGKTNE